MDRERLIDVLVAEKIFGCKPKYEDKCLCANRAHTDERGPEVPFIKFYSKEIKSAWEIVENWVDEECRFCNIAYNVTKPEFSNYWSCAFWDNWEAPKFIANAPTAPLAICLAALKAGGYDVENPPK